MSPVIILGLVLMWAVVLVPMWLRRHDEAEQSRSVDRFSAAMHTLSRHEERPTQRNVRAPHGAAVLDVHVSGASAPEALAARRRSKLARRRSRSLMLLLVADLGVLAGAFVVGGTLLWAAQAVLDSLIVFFFAHLRRMALLAEASRRRAVARQRDNAVLDQLEQEQEFEAAPESTPAWEEGITVYRTGSAAGRTAAVAEDIFDQTAVADEPEIDDDLAAGFDEAVALVAPAAVRMTANDGFFDQETDLGVVASVSFERDEQQVHASQTAHTDRGARAAAAAAAEVEAVGGKPWEPIPVPRPTYATKPAAPSYPAVPRRSEPMMPPVERTVEIESEDDLEAILDRRWAVND